MRPKIITSEFVKRQTSESRFSHTSHKWGQLAKLARAHYHNHVKGYRDGVVLVPVPAEGFYSALAKTKDVMEWVEVYEARQEHEEKVLTRYGLVHSKPEAKFVDIVLYHVDVLAEEETYSKSGNHEWEIISINARTEEAPAPIPPMTMARNFLVKEGGSKANYSAQEFADSIWFWNQHCLVAEKRYSLETVTNLELDSKRQAYVMVALSHLFNHYKDDLEKYEMGSDFRDRKEGQMRDVMEMILELDEPLIENMEKAKEVLKKLIDEGEDNE